MKFLMRWKKKSEKAKRRGVITKGGAVRFNVNNAARYVSKSDIEEIRALVGNSIAQNKFAGEGHN